MTLRFRIFAALGWLAVSVPGLINCGQANIPQSRQVNLPQSRQVNLPQSRQVILPGRTQPALQSQPESFEQPWRWVHFTTECGLPSPDVRKTVRTSDGTMWVLTVRGIAWYDNFVWRTVDSVGGLLKVQPTDIESDLSGNLLVVAGGRLYKGNQKGFQSFQLPNVRGAVMISQDRGLVIANDSLYLFRNGQFSLFKSNIPVGVGQFGDLVRTQNGKIWLRTYGTLYYLEGETWKVKLSTGPPYGFYWYVQETDDGTGTVYEEATRCVYTWHGTSAPKRMTGTVEIPRSLAASERGEILISYESGHVASILNGVWTPSRSFRDEIPGISRMEFEKNGDLWVCSESGLWWNRHSLYRWGYRSYPHPDQRNLVNEVVIARDGKIWLGEEGGVEVIEPGGSPGLAESSRMITSINNVAIQSVTGVAEDDNGHIWISSGSAFGGAYRWDGHGWKYFRISEDSDGIFVHKIFKDRTGKLWFAGLLNAGVYEGHQPGAYVYDGGKFTRWGKEEGLITGRVYAFAQDSGGAYWFGTWGGMSRWKDGKWTHWACPTEIHGPRVYNIAVDRANRVWFSGGVEGLAYIDSADHIQYATDDGGKALVKIENIVADAEGTVWIAGLGGISRFRNNVWSHFTMSNGLNSPHAWPLVFSNEKLYAGTLGDGLAILDMEEEPAPPPRVLIDIPRVERHSVLLRWRAMPYLGETPLQDVPTQYRLDGAAWTDWTNNRELTFDDVPYGDHTFSVRAKSLFGVTEDTPPSVRFNVPYPLYLQPLFLAPILGLTVVLGYVGTASVMRRRKDARALRQSEMKFRRLTEATFEGILIHEKGEIRDVNQSFQNVFGYTPEEILGKSFLQLTAPESRDIVERNLLAESGTMYEAMAVTKEGKKIPVEIIGRTLPPEHRTASVLAVRDITERKKAEAQLLTYQEQLKALAARLSMTEEQERRRMATYLHDYIGQTLALCKIKLKAHGLAIGNAPASGTTVASGSAPAAVTTPALNELEDVRKLLDQMIENTHSLTFELSPPVLHELDFGDAIEWLTEHMQELHSTSFAFSDDGSLDSPGIEIRTLLFHSVRELLVNIVKHAGADHATVSLSASPAEIRIEVTDDGAGFDPQVRASEPGKGGGYGLFNIRERLTFYGGRMEIHSAPGRGTKVTLITPITASPESEEAARL